MSTNNYRVNLAFAGYSDSDLGDFVDNIIASMTGNPSFPTPPVSMAVLGTERTAFGTAVINAMQGGTQLTAIKRAAKKTVITSLRKNAAYVQSIASQDVAMLLSSGYQANSTNRAQTQLDIPVILAILNEMTTTLTVRLQPVDNARAYQVRYSERRRVAAHRGFHAGTADHPAEPDAGNHLHRAIARRRRCHGLQRMERSKFAHGDVRGRASKTRVESKQPE